MSRIKDLIERVNEVREIVADNGAEELAENITVDSVLNAVSDDWTVEDELRDLIWESWGEDC